jgi:hypothetical protein
VCVVGTVFDDLLRVGITNARESLELIGGGSVEVEG